MGERQGARAGRWIRCSQECGILPPDAPGVWTALVSVNHVFRSGAIGTPEYEREKGDEINMYFTGVMFLVVFVFGGLFICMVLAMRCLDPFFLHRDFVWSVVAAIKKPLLSASP